MAISHDAYHFDTRAFAEELRGEVRRIGDQPAGAYQSLRRAAVQSVRQSEMVQRLADAYGGWDETSIAQELPQSWSNDPADISFCLLLLLYRRVSDLDSGRACGLGTSWRLFDGVLQCAGWGDSERALLIRGHNFGVFWDRYLSDNVQSSQAAKTRRAFQGIRPPAIAASAGWMERSEAIALKQRLDSDRDRIRSAVRNADELEALRRGEELLQITVSHDKDLCLIVSG